MKFKKTWLPVALTALLPWIFFWKVTVGRETFFLRDLFHYFYPIKYQVIQSLRNGAWPLWEGGIFLGKPLLGDPSAGVFDPANLLYFILPFNFAFQIYFLLHLSLFAVGFGTLARRLGAKPAGAWIGASVMSFSSGFLFLTTHYSYFGAYCLVPWVVLWLGDLFHAAGRKTAALLALAVAIQFFKGEPQIVYLEGLATLLCLILGYVRNPKRFKKQAPLLVLSGLLATGLILCQAVASWEYLQNSTRQGGLAISTVLAGSLHPFRLLEYFVPYVWGNPLGGERFQPPFQIEAGLTTPWSLSYYFGVTWLVAPWLLFPIRKAFKKPAVRLAFGLWALFLLLALGHRIPLVPQLLSFIPGWRLFRTPEKFMVLAQGALILGLSLLWLERQDFRPALRKSALAPWLLIFFCGVQVVDTFWQGYQTRLTRPASFYDTKPELLEALEDAGLSKGRLYAYRSVWKTPRHTWVDTQEKWNALQENVGTAFGVSYLAGYSTAVPKTFVDLWSALQADPQAHFNLYGVRYLYGPAEELVATKPRIIGGMGEDSTDFLAENVHALPEMFLITGVERPVIEKGALVGAKVSTAPAVSIARQNNHHLTVELGAPLPESAWLLWSQNTDRHWQAKIAGSQRGLEILYPGIRGIALEKGTARLELSYEAPLVRGLAFLSAFSLAVCLFLVIL